MSSLGGYERKRIVWGMIRGFVIEVLSTKAVCGNSLFLLFSFTRLFDDLRITHI